MKFSGAIFDFNGTLFWDTEMHIIAWREFSRRLRGTAFTDEEMIKHMMGKTNLDIVSYAIGKRADIDFAAQVGEEKEEYYRQMCRKNINKVQLAPGAQNFLDFLCKNNLPRNIATMSDKNNVDFFIEIFKLEKWFDTDKIVFNNGKIPAKPAPDVFQIAAAKVNLNPSECVMVEDSGSGIQAALNAGAGKVYAVKSINDEDFYATLPKQCEIIKDFSCIDTSLFNAKVITTP